MNLLCLFKDKLQEQGRALFDEQSPFKHKPPGPSTPQYGSPRAPRGFYQDCFSAQHALEEEAKAKATFSQEIAKAMPVGARGGVVDPGVKKLSASAAESRQGQGQGRRRGSRATSVN